MKPFRSGEPGSLECGKVRSITLPASVEDTNFVSIWIHSVGRNPANELRLVAYPMLQGFLAPSNRWVFPEFLVAINSSIVRHLQEGADDLTLRSLRPFVRFRWIKIRPWWICKADIFGGEKNCWEGKFCQWPIFFSAGVGKKTAGGDG